jgi:hypothetical protein
VACIAIMQPTFLPWAGYFDLIDQADVFIYLDTVEFSRQSWHHRNRIKTAQGLIWLTLPVTHSQSEGTTLDEARIGDVVITGKWRKTLAQAYAKADHAADHLPWIDAWLGGLRQGAPLTDANIELIEQVCAKLPLSTPRFRASELPKLDGRADRLVQLCRHFSATKYLSPIGAAAYLRQDIKSFTDAGIEVRFHNYEHPNYRQQHGTLLPYASVIDMLLNEGPASLNIIRAGRRPSLDAESVFRRIDAGAA